MKLPLPQTIITAALFGIVPVLGQEPEMPPQPVMISETSTETLPPFDDYLPETSTPNDLPGPPTGPAVNSGQQMQEVQADIEEERGGYQLTDASLNDVFQLLAEEANRQYFHNPRIAGEEFRVTGRLISGDPLSKMEEMAFQYGLEMYEKGNTVYALTKDQLVDLPSKEWHYQLRYLRPTDIEGIKAMVAPYLSPGTGIVNYEPKTNTVIVIDTPHKIERVESFFKKVDKPQGQIVVEVKILNVNSSVASRIGADWVTSLGRSGLSTDAVLNLGAILGLDSTTGTSTSTSDDSKFVLSPFELSGVLRALNEGGLVEQNSNPVVITEDNEEAVISLIDRVPIITTTINQNSGTTNLTEEVRYTIDKSDPVGDPASTREVGITVAVTPSLLPDGTIRMKMRPRSAQIVEEIVGQSGNRYPRVSESTIETIARIPDGHSLVVGGFYGEVKTKNGNKIPVLGDIPLLNFFFKSKETLKENSSLIFVVTPTSYSPENEARNYAQHTRITQKLAVPQNHQWINPNVPGEAHESDYCRTMQAIQQDLRRETYRNKR
ncbi:MAG: secretin N-terminal domain-containing protein [Verrucomicrobiota bacterium]